MLLSHCWAVSFVLLSFGVCIAVLSFVCLTWIAWLWHLLGKALTPVLLCCCVVPQCWSVLCCCLPFAVLYHLVCLAGLLRPLAIQLLWPCYWWCCILLGSSIMILLCCDIVPVIALSRLCRCACGGVFDLLCLQCCTVLLRQCSCALVPAMLEWSACGFLSLGCEHRCNVWPALLRVKPAVPVLLCWCVCSDVLPALCCCAAHPMLLYGHAVVCCWATGPVWLHIKMCGV